MAENKNKRTLEGIGLTAVVGTSMLANMVNATTTITEYAKRTAPEMQEYIGSIGSTSIEYTIPGIAFFGTMALGALATKATDYYYLLNRKK